jgi:two-component system, cell cycle sensor histidine kinase and response regulator CckA
MPTLLSTHSPGLIEAILDDVGVALAVVDHTGRVVLANRAARRTFGDENPAQGLAFAEWRRRFRFQDSQGRDIPTEDCALVRLLAGQPQEAQELRVILPDGRQKWLHAAGHRFSVLGLIGVLVVIADETEQVELRRSAEQFQRLESAGVLAAGLAHDFNNMLTVAGESAALALTDPGVPEVTRERLRQVSLAVKKGSELVGRLVQFSHTRELQKRSVQMNRVVEAAVELVRPTVGSKVRLTVKLHPDLPSIEAAPSEIEQVLVNLLLNALDAMPTGGVITVETQLSGPEAVTCHEEEPPEGFITISVADNGVGIPESLQAMIFEPFFTTKPLGKGAGLGLSVAYGIVRQHQGSIKVESRPGAGTKFTIYLPVKKTSGSSIEAA